MNEKRKPINSTGKPAEAEPATEGFTSDLVDDGPLDAEHEGPDLIPDSYYESADRKFGYA
jgi:hypothetical protein